MMSRWSGDSGLLCVNRHSAKSISSIAVPDVIPRISKSSPGPFRSGDGEFKELAVPLTFACNAWRYLCPTCVRTRPLGAGISPLMVLDIKILGLVGRRRRVSLRRKLKRLVEIGFRRVLREIEALEPRAPCNFTVKQVYPRD